MILLHIFHISVCNTRPMDERARRISETMKSKKLDNFKKWRDKEKEEGRIKSVYEPFEQNGNLAELIGVVLGDGHIQAFPRTERLLIFSHAQNLGFITRYRDLVANIVHKEPYVYKVTDEECVRISLYQKEISSRLGVPTGARKEQAYELPEWIRENERYQLRLLRGLYEAEGSLSFHPPTYTHKLIFTNYNISLLDLVFELVKDLGFHPHRTKNRVQLSRKGEVQNLVNLLEFRDYSR